MTQTFQNLQQMKSIFEGTNANDYSKLNKMAAKNKNTEDVEEGYESWGHQDQQFPKTAYPSSLESSFSESSFDDEWLEINRTLAANELLVNQLQHSLKGNKPFTERCSESQNVINTKTASLSSRSSTSSTLSTSNHAPNDSFCSMPYNSYSSSSSHFNSSASSSVSTSPSSSFRSSAGSSNSVPIGAAVSHCYGNLKYETLQQKQLWQARSGATSEAEFAANQPALKHKNGSERVEGEENENSGARHQQPQCTEMFTRSPVAVFTDDHHCKSSTSSFGASTLGCSKYNSGSLSADRPVDYNHNLQQLQQLQQPHQTEQSSTAAAAAAAAALITSSHSSGGGVSGLFHHQRGENKQNPEHHYHHHHHQWSTIASASPQLLVHESMHQQGTTKQKSMLEAASRALLPIGRSHGGCSSINSSKKLKKGFKRLNNTSANSTHKHSHSVTKPTTAANNCTIPLSSSSYLRAKASAMVAAVTVRLRRLRGKSGCAKAITELQLDSKSQENCGGETGATAASAAEPVTDASKCPNNNNNNNNNEGSWKLSVNKNCCSSDDGRAATKTTPITDNGYGLKNNNNTASEQLKGLKSNTHHHCSKPQLAPITLGTPSPQARQISLAESVQLGSLRRKSAGGDNSGSNNSFEHSTWKQQPPPVPKSPKPAPTALMHRRYVGKKLASANGDGKTTLLLAKLSEGQNIREEKAAAGDDWQAKDEFSRSSKNHSQPVKLLAPSAILSSKSSPPPPLLLASGCADATTTVPKEADSASDSDSSSPSQPPPAPHHHHSSASLNLDKKEEKNMLVDDGGDEQNKENEEEDAAVKTLLVSGGNDRGSSSRHITTTDDDYDAFAGRRVHSSACTRNQWMRPMTDSTAAASRINDGFYSSVLPLALNLRLKSSNLKRRQNRRSQSFAVLRRRRQQPALPQPLFTALDATEKSSQNLTAATTAKLSSPSSSAAAAVKQTSKQGEKTVAAAAIQLALKTYDGNRRKCCTNVVIAAPNKQQHCSGDKVAKNIAVDEAAAAAAAFPSLPFAPELSSHIAANLNPESSASSSPPPSQPLVQPVKLDSPLSVDSGGGKSGEQHNSAGDSQLSSPQLLSISSTLLASPSQPLELPTIWLATRSALNTTTTESAFSVNLLHPKRAKFCHSLHRSSIDATAVAITITISNHSRRQQAATFSFPITVTFSSPSSRLPLHHHHFSSSGKRATKRWCRFASTFSSISLSAALSLVVKREWGRGAQRRRTLYSYSASFSHSAAYSAVLLLKTAVDQNRSVRKPPLLLLLLLLQRKSRSRPPPEQNYIQNTQTLSSHPFPHLPSEPTQERIDAAFDFFSSAIFPPKTQLVQQSTLNANDFVCKPAAALDKQHALSSNSSQASSVDKTTLNQLTYSSSSSSSLFPCSIPIVPFLSHLLVTQFHPLKFKLQHLISSIPHHHSSYHHQNSFLASFLSLKPTSTQNKPILNHVSHPSVFSLQSPNSLKSANLVENLLKQKTNSKVLSLNSLSSSQLIFIRLQALTELLLMSKNTLQHIVTVEHLPAVATKKKSKFSENDNDDENGYSFNSNKPKNRIVSLQSYLPLLGSGGGGGGESGDNNDDPMDQKMAKMVKSSNSTSSSPLSVKGDGEGGKGVKSSSKGDSGSRPISPSSIFSSGPQPLPTPPTQPTTTATKSKSNHFSSIFLRPDRFRSSKQSDSAKQSGEDQKGQQQQAPISSIRRSDSPSINRSSSSVGSSNLYGSSPGVSGSGGGDYHHRHRPSMPSTTLVKDLNQMDLSYLASGNQQAIGTVTDHLSPSSKAATITSATTLPHPSSTPSLTSIMTAADQQQSGITAASFNKSSSPSPLATSPVSTTSVTIPITQSTATNLVTPITTTTPSTSTTLRRPSSIGTSGSTSGRLASSSFSSPGGPNSTGLSPLSGGKTPIASSSSASLNMVAAVGKYPRKVLRGPWGEMLESRMSCSEQLMNLYPLDYHDCGSGQSGHASGASTNRNSVGDPQHFSSSSSLFSPHQFNYLKPNGLSFTDELLRQTKVQRAKLDKDSRETVGTASPTEHKPEFPCFGSEDADGSSSTAAVATGDEKADVTSGSHPHHSSTEVEESEESEEEATKTRCTEDGGQSSSLAKDGDTGTSSEGGTTVSTTGKSRPLPPTVVVTEVVSAGPSITEAIGRHLDTRAHIVGELYDTEKNYVEVLRTLNESYFRKYRPASEESNSNSRGSASSSAHHSPSSSFSATSATSPTTVSSNSSTVTGNTGADHNNLQQQSQLRWLEFVAARLPPVMDYHGKLLEQLRRRIADWCPDSTPIGDLFHSFFVNVEVLQFYESMVDHLAELSAILKAQYRALEAAAAKELAKMASSERKQLDGGGGGGGVKDSGNLGSSSAGSSGLGGGGQAAAAAKRQSRRLAPDYLLISTIQRIPRYELLLQRLIKNTGEEHADYASLSQALGIIHDVLVKIGTYSSTSETSGGGGGPVSQKHESFNSGTHHSPSSALTSASSSAATSPSSTLPGEPISAVTASVTLHSSPQTAISMPIGQQQQQQHQTINSTDPGSSSSSHRQLFIRDLEPVVEGAQSALEGYSSNGPVHLFEYVTVRKGRERALFVLDDALLLCTVKSKKKADRFEYNKFKMQQFIRLETVDLRCACWQHWIQEAEKAAANSSSLSSLSGGSNSGSGGLKGGRDQEAKGSADLLSSHHHHHYLGSSTGLGDHHYGGGHHHHSSQPAVGQQLASSGCRACIETLEADIKALLKLQSSVHQITTASIRAGLSSHLTEVVQSVYSQLVEMHETVARCAKDLSVDVYILPTSSGGDSSSSAAVSSGGHLVDPGLYAQGGGGLSESTPYQSEAISSSGSSPSSHIFTHHSTSSNSNQITKSVRLVHYKCPRHQPSRFSFQHQQQAQQDPEYTFTFADSRRRAAFEFIVTTLRAQIIKSRLKLHFLRAIPYEKTRAGLQFTCASAATGTNHVWVCKSDGFVGQISVLEVNTTATSEHPNSSQHQHHHHHHHHQRTSLLDEPTVISCNGVCNAQIVAMTTVPANSASASFIPPPPPPPPPSLFACASSVTPPSVHKLLESAAAGSGSSEVGARSHGRNSSTSSSIFTSLGFGRSHSHRSGNSGVQPTGENACVEETDASEPESEHSTSTAISTGRSSRKSQNSSSNFQQHSTSPSKSAGSTLFSHLKPKASRTKSTPQTSSAPPPLQSSPSQLSQQPNPSTLQHSISQQPTPTTTSNSTSKTPLSNLSSQPSSLQTSSQPTPSSNAEVSEVTQNTSSEQSPSATAVTTTAAEAAAAPTNKLSISHDSPTMWFGTDDSTIHIYSCFDAVRIGKNKAKVTLSDKVNAIQYFGGKVFVGLANQTVAVFTKDATGYWQTTPTIIEGINCYRFCPVNVGRLNESLWTTSRNVITIRNDELTPLEDPIHVDELAEISFIVSNQQSILLTSANSAYLYRYSPVAPYSRLGTISIGPFVNKALALTEDIIRHHKNACLKVSAMETVQERVWIGTSAGVILVLDNKNTIEIIPNGHTGHVRFITSHRLQDGQGIVVSGGDGYEQFSPGTGSNLAGPTDLFHFMSYCSNLALNLLGRSSSNSNMTSVMQQAGSGNNSSSTGSTSTQSQGNLSTLPPLSSSTPTATSSSSSPSSASHGNRVSTLSPSPSSVSGTSTFSSASSTTSSNSLGSATLVPPASSSSPTAATSLGSSAHESTESLTTNSAEIVAKELTTNNCFNTSASLSANAAATAATTSVHSHQLSKAAGADDSKSYLLIWKI